MSASRVSASRVAASRRIALAVLAFARLTSSKVYLYEDFSGDWEDRWVVSDWKQDSGEAGRWEVSAGRFLSLIHI